MQVKTIVRLELPSGQGVYSAGIPIVEDLEPNARHPLPQHDSKLWFELGCRYVVYNGPEDLPAVHAASEDNISKWWFAYEDRRMCSVWWYSSDWLYALHEAGVVVSEYVCDARSVITGNSQTIFSSYITRFMYDIPTYFAIPVR